MSRCTRSGCRARRPRWIAATACKLRGVRITNAVKCLPPENKPLPVEIKTCNQYLAAELAKLHSVKAVLALGTGGARGRAGGRRAQKRSAAKFGHGAEHVLPDGRHLVDSYHCSRYNTQTRRLTAEMFQHGAEAGRDARGFIIERVSEHADSFDPKEYIPNLPRRPGVYRMYSGAR